MTLRTEGKVRRERTAELSAALAVMREAVRAQQRRPPREAIDLRMRRFEPVGLVALRAELKGPGRRRGGIDVRGDGSAEAWRGWVGKRIVTPAEGEDAVGALERVLGGPG